MEKIKWSNIIMALIYIALGVLFVIKPMAVGSTLCYILAAAVAVLGLLYLIGFFIQRPEADGSRSGNGFVFGVLLIVMAVFIVVKQNLVITLVPFLFGVMVTVRGLMGVQSTLIMRRLGKGGKWMFLAGLVTMALGIFIMMFPFKTAQMLFILIGAGLLVGGLAGLAEEIMIRIAMSRKAHAEERERDMGPKDAEIEEEPVLEEAPVFEEEPVLEEEPAIKPLPHAKKVADDEAADAEAVEAEIVEPEAAAKAAKAETEAEIVKPESAAKAAKAEAEAPATEAPAKEAAPAPEAAKAEAVVKEAAPEEAAKAEAAEPASEKAASAPEAKPAGEPAPRRKEQ